MSDTEVNDLISRLVVLIKKNPDIVRKKIFPAMEMFKDDKYRADLPRMRIVIEHGLVYSACSETPMVLIIVNNDKQQITVKKTGDSNQCSECIEHMAEEEKLADMLEKKEW